MPGIEPRLVRKLVEHSELQVAHQRLKVRGACCPAGAAGEASIVREIVDRLLTLE